MTKEVSKKGNPNAPNVDELVTKIKDQVFALGIDFNQFTNPQLLNLSKDRRILGLRQHYNELLQYHKFMRGDDITEENYDKVKKYIRKDYKTLFFDKKDEVEDKKTGLKTTVLIPMARNTMVRELSVKSEAELLKGNETTEFNHFMIDNQSKLESAQAYKLQLQSQVKMAQSIAHSRQAKELAEAKGQVKDVNTIWHMVKAREEGRKYVEYMPPTVVEVPVEKEILASF